MNKSLRGLVAASGIATVFALSGCSDNGSEPESPNAENPNVTTHTFNGTSRFVRFDDDQRAGHLDQMTFYRKDGFSWEPTTTITQADINPHTAAEAAQKFIETNGVHWDLTEGSNVGINSDPDPLDI